MGLLKDEVEQLILKLRDNYSQYAEKYSSKWFNIEAFEERMQMALQNSMNLEGFILAEISNFEKIKERYEKKKQGKSFSHKVDKIIEENISRIKKYPELVFHSHAGLEITHFYGAMAEFAFFYFPILWILIKNTSLKNKINKFEENLDFLAVSRGEKPPKRIDDHIIILSRPDVQEIEIEKDKNEYLKESAFLLHDIIDFCEGLMEVKEPELEVPVSFNKLFIDEKRKMKISNIFLNFTGYGAILKVEEYASNIISDFRLGAFIRR